MDSKKASLHRYQIIHSQERKAVGVELSLSHAEQNVVVARANYKEVSARVLREVDRFRRENAVAMYATMEDFARIQKEHADRVSKAWGALVLLVENVDATRLEGTLFVQAAKMMRQGSGSSRSVVTAAGVGGNTSSKTCRCRLTLRRQS